MVECVCTVVCMWRWRCMCVHLVSSDQNFRCHVIPTLLLFTGWEVVLNIRLDHIWPVRNQSYNILVCDFSCALVCIWFYPSSIINLSPLPFIFSIHTHPHPYPYLFLFISISQHLVISPFYPNLLPLTLYSLLWLPHLTSTSSPHLTFPFPQYSTLPPVLWL